MKVSANHEKLVTLGQRRFDGFTPHQVVTFLNQVLKGRGLIFGIRQVENHYEMTIYDAEATSDEP